MKLVTNSIESKSTRNMVAKRVHVSGAKGENSLHFKEHRLEFPKSTTSFLGICFSGATSYSSSSSFFHLQIIWNTYCPVNSVLTVSGLPATNSCVSTSISDDMKKLLGKKKNILNFALPKSVISLPTNFSRNVICFSFF